MFIEFWLICLIEKRSKTFLAKSSNLSGEGVLPTTAAKTWRSERFQVSFSFDNRCKFKAAFRTSETKNGKIQYYFEVKFKFWTIAKATGVKMTAKAVEKTQAFALAWRIIWINIRSRSKALMRNFDHFLLLNRFLRLSVNENLLLLSFLSHFFLFRSLYLGVLGFKSEQYLARWISAYLIYNDHQRSLFNN